MCALSRPYALPFLSLAVASLLIWRSWLLRATALPLALIGLIGAANGPRYDVIIAPSGDQVALRDADGRLEASASASTPSRPNNGCRPTGTGARRRRRGTMKPHATGFGCVGALPEGQSLALVEDRLAFEEDCARAEIIVSALTAPAGCQAGQVFDERRLARTGAVGLVWRDGAFEVATDRALLEDRPWSPAPRPAHTDRVVRPGQTGGAMPADPADPIAEPQ